MAAFVFDTILNPKESFPFWIEDLILFSLQKGKRGFLKEALLNKLSGKNFQNTGAACLSKCRSG